MVQFGKQTLDTNVGKMKVPQWIQTIYCILPIDVRTVLLNSQQKKKTPRLHFKLHALGKLLR